MSHAGMLNAWMITSNVQQETLTFFPQTVRARNGNVKLKWIMSDKDHAQMNSIRLIYPESQLLLCWWHVLHTWQQYFVTSHHPELWSLLKAWVRITNQETFDRQWECIKALAPASVTQYLETEWWAEQDLWSAVIWKDCSVLELSDTNMLVEA